MMWEQSQIFKYPFPLYFLVFSFFHANSKCLQGYIDDKYLCYSTLNWSTAAASNSIRTAMISHWTFQNIKKSLLCFGLFNKAQSFAPEVDSTLTTLNICRLQTWWFLSISRPSDSGPLEHQLRFRWNKDFFSCYDEVGSDQMDKLGLVVDQGEGLVLKAYGKVGHKRGRRAGRRARRRRRGGLVKDAGQLLHRSFVLHQQ